MQCYNNNSSNNSNTSSLPVAHSADGDKDSLSQSRPNETPSDITKNTYEGNMGDFFAYYQRSASYNLPYTASGTPSAMPSPTAPGFTPSGTNENARSEAMKKFHSERYLRKLQKLERALKEEVQKLAGDLGRVKKTCLEEEEGKAVETFSQTQPSSPHGGSVGSWTEDDEFIPNIRK